MIRLFDHDTDDEIGDISESHFDLLQEQLVEETLDNNTYNIDSGVLDSLENNGVERDVVGLLRKALGSRSSMTLRYEFD